MASKYKQNGLDIDSLACDYGTSSSPRISFSDNGYAGFGTFSYKSSADSSNTGIQAFTCLYKIKGTSYNLIKRGAFPAWYNSIADLTTPGTYYLKSDGSTYLRITNSSGTVLSGHNYSASDFKDGVIPEYIIVEVQGAGGGGGGSGAFAVGKGGGSGGYAHAVIAVPSDGLEIVVGAGGSGGGKSKNGSSGEASYVQHPAWDGNQYTGYVCVWAGGGHGGKGAENGGGSGGSASVYNAARTLCTASGASGAFNNDAGMPSYSPTKFYISLDTSYQSASAMKFEMTTGSGGGSAEGGSGGGGTSRGWGGIHGDNDPNGTYGGGGWGAGDGWILSREVGGSGGNGFVRIYY